MNGVIPNILTVAAMAAACVSAQDRQAFETRRYDVRALAAMLGETSETFDFSTPPGRPGGGVGDGSLRYLHGQHGERDRESEGSGEFTIKQLVRFAVRAELGPDAWANAIAWEGGDLLVTGPASLCAHVERVLAWLTSALPPAADVELVLLPREALAATSSAVLDGAKFDRLVEVAKPVATLRKRIRVGSEATFESVARRAYVKDYDTEVAMEARIADPLVDVLPEGVRVSVRVDQAQGGGFLVSVRGQQCEMNGPFRTPTLHYVAPALLQLPTVWWNSASASARVDDGGALLTGSDLAPRGAWAVRLRAGRRPDEARDAPLHLFPIGGLKRARVDTPAPWVLSPLPSGVGSAAPDPDDPRDRLTPERVDAELASLFAPGAAVEERSAKQIGAFVVTDPDPKLIANTRDVLARLANEVSRGFSVQVRFGSVPGEGFALPAYDELETLAVALPQTAWTAAVAGDRVLLLAGQQHSYIQDRDVMIAQKISVDDPMVGGFFTGLAMDCAALPAGGDACLVDVRLEYQELIEMASLPTGSLEVPEIDLPRIAAVRCTTSLDAPIGSWVLVHTAPLEGTGRQLVVMLRVQPI